ncbi:hypothetical protein CBR_g55229 [Chara braunii]|uniref:Exocyst subunit Exo70 family protein n=1 Tax=Chara braunii TaxID=69332 RepID=A0A388MCQ5_CHABU|nr:hypothetical protein CBR_g55229 [Chara braunii]|eukprot:GBG92348.1 hypothetical protein CBR_g55229 [Chara braunii]
MGIETEKLSAKAQLIRESLTRSQMLTNSMVGILGTFDARLSALETAMRPTQVRTHAFRKAFENIEQALTAADSILVKFDVSRQVESVILANQVNDYENYFLAIDQLHEVVDFFDKKRHFKSTEAALHHALGLLNKALLKLEEEFRNLLQTHSKPVDTNKLLEAMPEQHTGGISENGMWTRDVAMPKERYRAGADPSSKGGEALVSPSVLLPEKITTDLHGMALRMLAGNRVASCTKMYREIRSTVLEQTLRKLGAEKLSKEDVHRLQWEDLESKRASWTQYMKIAVKVLFSGERLLCDQVFNKLNPFREDVFRDVTEPSMSMLLSFGEAICKSKKTPEKLFLLLDIYETLRDLMPEIDNIFSGAASSAMRDSCKTLTKRLMDVARETYAEFESVVERDNKPVTNMDGDVHEFTAWVVNYVKFLFKYQGTLKEIYGEAPEKTSTYLTESTKKIMQMLQDNLDAKAKPFKDAALRHIFLMNNVHYIVRSVRKSEAKDLLGDDWVSRHRRIVQQHASSYQRAAWGNVYGFYLSGKGLSSGSEGSDGNISRSSLKERMTRGDTGAHRKLLKDRFKNFNAALEQLHTTQSQWIIPDDELRDAVRLSVAEVLLPAYRSFLTRYGHSCSQHSNRDARGTHRYTALIPS